jgi:shikimate dehydrogenase
VPACLEKGKSIRCRMPLNSFRLMRALGHENAEQGILIMIGRVIMSEELRVDKYTIRTKSTPTFYFVGVTTGKSSIMTVFPRWAATLGHPEMVIEGIDHKLHDDPEAYRRTVAQIKYDPLSAGALVTSHKINLANAARDMFDELDPYSRITGEVSCITKRNGKLLGFAKDPITGGASLDAILGTGYFGRTGGDLLCYGAGGAGMAISLHLINKQDAGDRPRRMIIVNRSPGRLKEVERVFAGLSTDIRMEFICNNDPKRNDQIMEALPEGSVIINATGLGKDMPGSPITDAGLFPRNSIAWEINYRGELDFWQQAMAQKKSRNVIVQDGWLYFIYGWSEHVTEVLDIDIDVQTFNRLAEVAEDLRPPLVYKPRQRSA